MTKLQNRTSIDWKTWIFIIYLPQLSYHMKELLFNIWLHPCLRTVSSKYVQNHLRIISAFYGVLKPRDGVTPYRLEMQAKVGIGETKNLYEYWGELLYRSIIDDRRIIINLASKEYSKCIEKYLTPQDRYITIVFCELSGDKLVTKGTYAKMARGEMVRFIAENNIENPVEIQKFDRLGYSFRSDLSSDSEYVFERKIK